MLSNYFAILNKGGAEPAGQKHPMTKSNSTTTTNSILQLIPQKITTTNSRRTGHRKEQKPIMTRKNNHILRSILISHCWKRPSNFQEGTDSKLFYYDIHICREGHNNDEELMAIARAMMKPVLKATSRRQIYPLAGNIEMPIIIRNNSSLPKSIETKAIRKHIHKGNMNAGKFFGVIKVEHLSTADVLQAKLFPVLVLCTWKIYIQDQPHSSSRCVTLIVGTQRSAKLCHLYIH